MISRTSASGTERTDLGIRSDMSEEWMLTLKCAESRNASLESGMTNAVYSDY